MRRLPRIPAASRALLAASTLLAVTAVLAVTVCFAVTAMPARASEPDVAPSPAAPAEAPGLGASIVLADLPSCIDEAALEARVARLVRAERLNPDRRVEGSFTDTEAGRVVHFRVYEAQELVGVRRLEFQDRECAPLEEAVELVLAMLLEGHGFEPPTEEPVEALEAPVEAEEPAAPPPKPEKKPRVMGRFRLGPEVSFGVLPMPSAGLRLEGGVELSIPLAFFGRATWHLDDGLPIDGGGSLELGAYRLAGLACYLYRAPWVVSACAGVGFVSVEATGTGVLGASSGRFDQAAVILGARLGIPLASAWSFDLGVEAEAWFARPEYVLLTEGEPEIVASSSGVPVSGWIALSYAF